MKQGFTLMELSIVLTILALITGGILAGQNLVRAAQIRTVTHEADQFTLAVNIFMDKYDALPGDMENATRYWGAEPLANCPGGPTTPSTGTATCNGDGDGEIHWQNSAGLGGESHRFWQHLANAELIPGQYTGTHSAGSCNYDGSCNVTLGVNAPKSGFGNAGWVVYHVGYIELPDWYYFPGEYKNVLLFGEVGNYTSLPALTAEEAWHVDTKIDDGKPGTGWVRPWLPSYAASADCSSSIDYAVSEYSVANAGKSCQLVFDGRF